VLQPNNGETSYTLKAPDLHKLTTVFAGNAFDRSDRSKLLNQFLLQSIALINAAGAAYFSTIDQQLQAEVPLLSRQVQMLEPGLMEELGECAREAFQQKQACYRQLNCDALIFCISCPLPQDKGCLVTLLLTDTNSLSPFLLTLQLLATLLDQYLQPCTPVDSAPTTSPLVPFIDSLAMIFSLPPGKERILQLTQSLKILAGANLSALALPANGNKIKIAALSDVASIAAKTEQVLLLQKGIDECSIRNTPLCWPALDGQSIQPSLILEEIVHSTGGTQVVTLPLEVTNKKKQAVVLLVWNTSNEKKDILQTISNLMPLLAGILPCLTGAIKGNRDNSIKSKWSLQQKITTGVATLLLLLLLLPVPYRLIADAVVKPEITRFVVSRYDGMLLKALVRSGDQVHKGQEMARLDSRETEITLASVQAEREKAKKLRDQATALGKTAAAQVAHLDTLRYTQQVTRLQERLNHMTVICPVDGIVLTGDLQRAEGSPVSRGQTLFEVAPLSHMEVEVAIAEEDISKIQKNTMVNVRFDAYPDESWQNQLTRIEPRAQIRENRNIFLGILQFSNLEHKLRPGMRGKAKIHVGMKSLGWIIFHKPWYTFLRLLDFFI
jgi:RND family efflux transporter MFP subunit